MDEPCTICGGTERHAETCAVLVAARALGAQGGRARAARLGKRERKEIAKKGARARWGKKNKKEGK